VRFYCCLLIFHSWRLSYVCKLDTGAHMRCIWFSSENQVWHVLSSKLNQTRNSSNTEQQQTHPNVHPSKNQTRVAPVRPVRGTCQTSVTWASRDEQHPRVNTPKSKPRSPESLHGLYQDFGDSRNTSWESIAKFISTKSCQIKRNRRNPAKNTSNPRTPKTSKSSP
jgi:hypothetical protein